VSIQTPEKLVPETTSQPPETFVISELVEEEHDRIEYIRHFNRFYTRIVGALNEEHLKSGFSLAEVRVLYELAHQPPVTAAWLSRELALDPGYLSRLLSGFEARGLLQRVPSNADGRQSNLSLTDEGRGAFKRLDALVKESVAVLLAPLNEQQRSQLVGAMRTIESLLGS
jgi:DNA-binding MarR family transcriptional regulator